QELLEAVPRPTPRECVRDVVVALVEPLARDLRGGSHYVGFLGRVLAETGKATLPAAKLDTGYALVVARLRQALDELPEPVFPTRVWLTALWMVHAMANHDRQRDDPTAMPFDDFVEDLVNQLTAAMLAPAS